MVKTGSGTSCDSMPKCCRMARCDATSRTHSPLARCRAVLNRCWSEGNMLESTPTPKSAVFFVALPGNYFRPTVHCGGKIAVGAQQLSAANNGKVEIGVLA